MRLFIAITMTDAMKDVLIDIQNKMYDHNIRGYYTTEENFHLTLAFIGEYGNPDEIMDILSDIEFTPFDIELDDLGCFDDLWWVGIKDSKPLESLVNQIRRALSLKNIPYDKKSFMPHITLIRKAVGDIQWIESEKALMEVNTVSLMRSDRGKNGMIYTEIGVLEANE